MLPYILFLFSPGLRPWEVWDLFLDDDDDDDTNHPVRRGLLVQCTSFELALAHPAAHSLCCCCVLPYLTHALVALTWWCPCYLQVWAAWCGCCVWACRGHLWVCVGTPAGAHYLCQCQCISTCIRTCINTVVVAAVIETYTVDPTSTLQSPPNRGLVKPPCVDPTSKLQSSQKYLVFPSVAPKPNHKPPVPVEIEV